MISVVIPTYRNREQFLKNLEHNAAYLKGCEIIIVNDNPESDLRDALKKYPGIILVENKANVGFGQSVNNGVSKSTNPYIMLLNDDVLLNDDSFRNCLLQFKEDPSTFAVGFAQIEKNHSIVGKNRVYWKRGLIFHAKAHDTNQGFTAWAEGGSCMIDKKKFMELKGFDPDYSPFYWEDIDLSYRAWKSNYSVLFDPSITVIHHHETTIGTFFDKKFVKTVSFRNQLLFIWKNITDIQLILKHWVLLPYNCIYYLIKNEYPFINGMIKALPFLFNLRKHQGIKRDNEVLEIIF